MAVLYDRTDERRHMPVTVVFDVNETLLDLAAMDPSFARAFGDTGARGEWFAQLLQLALVVTITDTYRDFRTLAGEALDVVAGRRDVQLDEDARGEILGTIAHLPPHPEVPAALGALREAGIRLAALTNSPPATLKSQLTNAGLIDSFDVVLSVDPTRRFKPHPAPYLMAAEELATPTNELWMVAAHDWDLAGAGGVGFRTAFVARPGRTFAPGYPQPDLVGADLAQIADELTARFGDL